MRQVALIPTYVLSAAIQGAAADLRLDCPRQESVSVLARSTRERTPMDEPTAKQGLEALALVAVGLLEDSLDQAVIDRGPALAYAPLAERLQAAASDLAALAAAMAVISRRAASS